jgi:hypothetical protein
MQYRRSILCRRDRFVLCVPKTPTAASEGDVRRGRATATALTTGLRPQLEHCDAHSDATGILRAEFLRSALPADTRIVGLLQAARR